MRSWSARRNASSGVAHDHTLVFDGAAVGDRITDGLGRSGAKGRIRARAERVVDSRKRQSQGDINRHREDLRVAQPNVAELLYVRRRRAVGIFRDFPRPPGHGSLRWGEALIV